MVCRPRRTAKEVSAAEDVVPLVPTAALLMLNRQQGPARRQGRSKIYTAHTMEEQWAIKRMDC